MNKIQIEQDEKEIHSSFSDLNSLKSKSQEMVIKLSIIKNKKP